MRLDPKTLSDLEKLRHADLTTPTDSERAYARSLHEQGLLAEIRPDVWRLTWKGQSAIDAKYVKLP